MYSAYRHMYSVWVWYGTLQSVVLALLMIRLINKVGRRARQGTGHRAGEGTLGQAHVGGQRALQGTRQ